jgi:hypothetical protein
MQRRRVRHARIGALGVVAALVIVVGLVGVRSQGDSGDLVAARGRSRERDTMPTSTSSGERADPAATSSSTTDGPPTSQAVTSTPFCEDWPGVVGGHQTDVSSSTGVHIWSDLGGWHLRNNGPTEVVVKISAAGTMTVKAHGGATASTGSGKLITLTIPAGDGADGPDLDIPCEATSVTFQVSSAGADVSPTQIKVGDAGTADSDPVTFTRGQP